MTPSLNPWFLCAAALNVSAALLHLAIIIKGPAWYRFFGAGEAMARMAERGSWQPTLITLAIASVLALWASYALAAAGALPTLPWQRPILLAITSIYFLRALLYVPLLLLTKQPCGAFAWWSSAICLLFACMHLAGLLSMSNTR